MEDKKEKPGYYGILPAEVRYDKTISSSEKVLFTELSCLTNREGYCWASNKYFADLYEVSKFTVSRWVSNLEKAGHIRVDVAQSDTTDRKIWLNHNGGVLTKSATPIAEKRNTYCGKAQHNSISNIKSNINILSEEKTSDKEAVKAPRKDQPIVNVIEKFILVSPTAATKYAVPTWRNAASELITYAGGEPQALAFIDEFVAARAKNMLYLPVVDSLVTMVARYASIRQVLDKEKAKGGGYNVKGSGFKYSEPIQLTKNNPPEK